MTMTSIYITQPQLPWTKGERTTFRIAAIFVLLLILPLSAEWYSQLFHANSLFNFMRALTDYSPKFVTLTSENGKWGWQSYANWGVALLAAVAGGLLWSFFSERKGRQSYNELYYWLRVAVRYRIALGVLDYGFMKFYPVQMPYPSLGILNTNLGDLSGYKLYWQSVGVIPWYEVFLGCAEVFSAILLFFRPTTTIGAVLVAGILYNIAHANHAYDGGVHVFSAMFALLALFLLAKDLPALYQLLIKEKTAVSPEFVPHFPQQWKSFLLRGFKYFVVFCFTILYGYLRYDLHFVKHHLKKPATPGLAGSAGVYQVTRFQLNGKEIPYSPIDSIRWQEVILEKYSTLITHTCKLLNIPQGNGSRQDKDVDRSYELAGVGGGKIFYYYDADTVNRLLHLQDKGQVALLNGEGRISPTKKSKSNQVPTLSWHYDRPTENRLLLYGKTATGDSISAVLDRIPKTYLLESGL